MDIVVFGRAAALDIAEKHKPNDAGPELHPETGMESIANIDKLRAGKGQFPVADVSCCFFWRIYVWLVLI